MGEPNVILRGGPGTHRDGQRLHHTTNPRAKLKILDGNRYDHFEPTSETTVHQGRELTVFAWVRSTYVAE